MGDSSDQLLASDAKLMSRQSAHFESTASDVALLRLFRVHT